MTRAPQLDDIVAALEAATQAYMSELQYAQELEPESRLQFVTLGRDILELESRTHKLWISLAQKRR